MGILDSLKWRQGNRKGKSVALKGKYNIRAILAGGPLQKLEIDEIKDNQMIAAAALDTYSMIVQRCKSVVLYDCLNDTLEVPEIIIRDCERVELTSVVKCTIMQVHNSVLVANHETKKLHIEGDVILKHSTIEGYQSIIVSGRVYADGVSMEGLKGVNLTCAGLMALAEDAAVAS